MRFSGPDMCCQAVCRTNCSLSGNPPPCHPEQAKGESKDPRTDSGTIVFCVRRFFDSVRCTPLRMTHLSVRRICPTNSQFVFLRGMKRGRWQKPPAKIIPIALITCHLPSLLILHLQVFHSDNPLVLLHLKLLYSFQSLHYQE